MHRFAYFLSLPLALSTSCFNPSGGATTGDASTGSDASSTSTTGSTTAPTSGPTTTSSTGDATTQSGTVSSTTLPGTTDLTTTDFTSTTAITDTTDLTTLPDTTGVLPTCGDGQINPGEECDDGNNIDDDDCSNTCKSPKCGDGVVNKPGEECDDGNAENTDGCVADCKMAVCGDDFTQAGVEECDDGNDIEGDGCALGCKTEPLIVFVTKAQQTALQAQPANADSYCTAVAGPNFPNRTFVGWVSTKSNPVAMRLGPDKGRAYHLAKSGIVVAASRDQLLDGTLDHTISIDEEENLVQLGAEMDPCEPSPNFVWTGTNVDGSGTNNDCNGWIVNMQGMGTVGTIAAKDAKWTNKCTRPCSESYRLICIQKESM